MWDGCDFQFDKLNTILSNPQSGVLLWQVILDKMQPSQEISLEIRLLSGQSSGDTAHLQILLATGVDVFLPYEGQSPEARRVVLDVEELKARVVSPSDGPVQASIWKPLR